MASTWKAKEEMDHVTIYILEVGNGWNWLNTLVLVVLETLESVIKYRN
jgi:hypothetical protein